MKKIFLLLTTVAMLVFLAACSDRESLTAGEFTSLMENAGRVVEDVTNFDALDAGGFTARMTGAGHEVRDITEYVLAEHGMAGLASYLNAHIGGDILEFIVMDTPHHAAHLYGNLRDSFEADAEAGATIIETSISNFNRFRIEGGDTYTLIVRVENTVAIFITTAAERAAADSAMELLGYHSIVEIPQLHLGADGALYYLVADCGNFLVEFIVFESEQLAMRSYNGVRRFFVDSQRGAVARTESSVRNFSRYTQTSAGLFSFVSRVDNTLVIINTDSDNRRAADTVIELLGY